MPTKLTAVVIEALDVAASSRFWVEAVAGNDAGLELRFVPATGPKTGKNRLHFDLAGGPDQALAVQRLLDLGATRAEIGQGDVDWDVLADPEGNEFCVLPRPDLEFGLFQICLDAADPDVQGRFWTTATGWPVTARGEWGVCLRSADEPGPSLVMGPPVAAKSEPNRLQPVLTPRKPDLVPGDEIRLLLAAGASRLGDGVLRDPEGNEFRVAGLGP